MMADDEESLENVKTTRRALGATVACLVALTLSSCTRIALDGPSGTIIVDTDPYLPPPRRKRRRAHDDDDDDDF